MTTLALAHHCLACLPRRQSAEIGGPAPRSRCRSLPIEPLLLGPLGKRRRGRLPMTRVSWEFPAVRLWVPQLALGHHRFVTRIAGSPPAASSIGSTRSQAHGMPEPGIRPREGTISVAFCAPGPSWRNRFVCHCRLLPPRGERRQQFGSNRATTCPQSPIHLRDLDAFRQAYQDFKFASGVTMLSTAGRGTPTRVPALVA